SNTVRLEEKFLGSYDNAAFTVGNDGACKFNNEIYNIIFNMDDLLVFDGAFIDADAQKLSRYYGIK
ncbi:MAG: hypothetical protein GX851_07595, partial [Clostridiales bacterium]|nr:hypothetical protein [Clostridiales bacterium]